MRFSRRYLAMVGVALCASFYGAFAADSVRLVQRTLEIGGKKRAYLVYAPKHLGPLPRPVVVAFHGARGDGPGFERIAGLSKVAEREGFLLVYPEGVDKRWNDGRKEGASRADDLAFVDSLLEALAREFHTDPKRTYATGFSNGALLNFRLACERPARFAAIAAVGANMGLELSTQCKPTLPTAVLYIVGEKDPLMPFEGGRITGPFGGGNMGTVLSSDATLAFWVAQNKCRDTQPTALRGVLGKDGTAVDKTVFSQCAGAMQVARYVIREGGHTWPGGWQYLRQWIIGKTSQQLDASEAVWDFLSRHHR